MVPVLVVPASRANPDIAQCVGDVDHLYCCDPDLALCGEDISGDVDLGDDPLPQPCPLCEVLEHYACPRCGS